MDPVGFTQSKEIRCDSCHQIKPGYEMVNYGSVEHGYRRLCSQCFHTEVATADGLGGFEHANFEPVHLVDCTGKAHKFHFRTRLLGTGVALYAFELRGGRPRRIAPPSRRDASRWFCYCWPSQRSMQRIQDKVKAAMGRDNRPTLQEKLDRLNPILRGWSAYFGWLNSGQHFRKVDQYVTWKLRRWLQAKHQRRRRAFWKTPLAYWRKAGLYSKQGRIVHTS